MTLVSGRAFPAGLLPLLAALVASGCTGGQPVRLPGSFNLAGADLDGTRLRIGLADGRVARLNVDEYVSGSVPAEAALGGLDPATARATAEVQAIVARTYAFANRRRHAQEGFDLCATTHCQVYRPLSHWPAPIAELARDAARATSGLVITYGERPIQLGIPCRLRRPYQRRGERLARREPAVPAGHARHVLRQGRRAGVARGGQHAGPPPRAERQ